MRKSLFIVLILSLWFSLSAQNNLVDTTNHFELDVNKLTDQLDEERTIFFDLPLPSGETTPFQFEPSDLLTPKFCAKHPNIICLKGTSTLDKRTSASITIYKDKLYGMVLFPSQTLFINPTSNGRYDVKWKSTMNKGKVISQRPTCSVEHRKSEEVMIADTRGLTSTSNLQRRTYTIAVSTTGEYVDFHGGTREDALAAIAVTLNRVTSIYERDLNISFVLFDGHGADNLIYTNRLEDPYINDDRLNIADRVQNIFNTAIGFENYDIGHVFSTGSGGVATLGSVCGIAKAKGITGSSSPIGDAFIVDFVAHEIGHQLNAQHTFNGIEASCADNWSNQRFEPGSGSTIMAYAGICDSDNIQINSDDYFHIKSIEVIKAFSTTGRGAFCGTIENTKNSRPEIVQISRSNLVLPASTPFELEGYAIDIDQDSLTYTWEQTDIGSFSNFGVVSGNSPLFRSKKPETSGIRTFPALNDVLNNITRTEEILPNYSRNMSFQMTVRDQLGGIATDTIRMSVTANAGPFLVTGPEEGREFFISSFIPIRWNVAGTDTNGVNCESVDIYISYDNGETFSELLLNTPNDGMQMVELGTTASTEARIKVVGTNHLFFNVNNGPFSISIPNSPDYAISANTSKPVLCGSDITLQINTQVFNNFSDDIEYTVSFTPEVLSVNNSTGTYNPQENLEIILSPDLTEDTEVEIFINTSSGNLVRTLTLDIMAYRNDTPASARLISPEHHQQDLVSNVNFEWESSENNVDFILEVLDIRSDDVLNSLNLKESRAQLALEPNTFYNWRVITENQCGTSSSEIKTFATNGEICFSVTSSERLALSLNRSVFFSEIFVEDQGLLSKIKVDKLEGSHMYTDDLRFSLLNPENRRVILFESICNGGPGEDFNLQLESKNNDLPPVPCVPVSGNTYESQEDLTVFLGSDIKGTWKLQIDDLFPNLDEGVLEVWGLEICSLENTLITTIDDLNEQQKVYLVPNPTNRTIEIKNYEGGVKVLSVLGNIVKNTYLNTEKKLDLSDLDTGSYFVKLDSGIVLPLTKK